MFSFFKGSGVLHSNLLCYHAAYVCVHHENREPFTAPTCSLCDSSPSKLRFLHLYFFLLLNFPMIPCLSSYLLAPSHQSIGPSFLFETTNLVSLPFLWVKEMSEIPHLIAVSFCNGKQNTQTQCFFSLVLNLDPANLGVYLNEFLLSLCLHFCVSSKGLFDIYPKQSAGGIVLLI